jgi:hypothetical protein
MNTFTHWFLYGSILFLGFEIWDLKSERAEYDSALLQLNDKEIYLDEYTRILALEIADIKADLR